jgi:hypothetical protein
MHFLLLLDSIQKQEEMITTNYKVVYYSLLLLIYDLTRPTEWIFSRMFKVIELPERSLSRVYSEIELQSGHRMSCTMDPSFLDLFSQYRVDIFLLASVNMFPTFMESSEYQTWSIRERSHRTDEFSCQRYDSPIEGEGASEIFSHLHLQPQMIRDIVDGSWLKTVLRCIDRLPIAVTLVTANPDRSNFPLVYLNLAFTAMTGYEKVRMAPSIYSTIL